MKDPRIERKKLHPLENIILISIAAVICGAETWEDIEDFGYAKFHWFSGILDMTNGVPSHDTFNRFFSALDPKEFENHFIRWVQSIITSQGEEIKFIGIDGKTIRQSSKMLENDNIHIVSAFASCNELTLGQIKTDQKSNEITAIPKLLDALFLENSIITIDAMGCQKEIAEKIREKEAHYILAVKENHPTLYDDITSSFSLLRSEEFHFSAELDHGRIENRNYSIINNLKYISQAGEWKDLHAIIKVESERIIKKTGETSHQIRYFISSNNDNGRTIKGIRNHWGIENKLHWTLDVTFNEDQSMKRNGYAPQNFSLLNKLVLNLLKKDQRKISMRRKRKIAGWDEGYLWALIEMLKK